MVGMDEANQELNNSYAPQAGSRLSQGGCRGLDGGCRGLDNATQSCKVPSLLERIEGQAQAAEYQGMKACRLRELSDLLAKYPDIARILELLGEVQHPTWL